MKYYTHTQNRERKSKKLDQDVLRMKRGNFRLYIDENIKEIEKLFLSAFL